MTHEFQHHLFELPFVHLPVSDHDARPGDAVLVEVVRRMQSALRHYDAIGRYGGEEFIAVMPGVDKQRAARISERLRLPDRRALYTGAEELSGSAPETILPLSEFRLEAGLPVWRYEVDGFGIQSCLLELGPVRATPQPTRTRARRRSP